MKLTFKKEFDGDLEKLPKREVEGAVIFKEPESIKKLSMIANAIGAVIIVAAWIPIFITAFKSDISVNLMVHYLVALLLALLVLFPHEILHALCFKEDVQMYTYLKKGLMFVVGTEDMSKKRFVFMSMLPNICFGIIPYILFFFFPEQLWLGFFGAVNLGAGAGDYINVFNALTQVPNGAKVFMSGHRSYWHR